LANGERVRNVKTWVEKRRPEIFRVIESEFFGRSPERPKDLHWEVTESGRAYDRQGDSQTSNCLLLLEKGRSAREHPYLSARDAKGPVPLFLGLSFVGNQQVSADAAIELPQMWNREHTRRERAPESSRSNSPNWPVQKILARGYGLATIGYEDIDPDFAAGCRTVCARCI
jgi:hypothetical protein